MRRLLPWSILLGFMLSGCGGGGDTIAPAAVPVKFSVKWPLRSLNFQAPASAQSAILRLPRGREDGQDAVVSINRNGGAAPYDDSIVSVDRVRVGAYEARVEFKAERDGLGALVAVANARVNVDKTGSLLKPDGTPLGTVTSTSVVRTVQWVGGSGFLMEQDSPLLVQCLDQGSNLIAVSPGSIFVDVVSGTGGFSVTSDGKLRPTSTGQATVRFRVDGVSSQPVATATLSLKRIATPNDVLAVTPSGKLLVGSRTNKTIIEYNASTAARLRTFNLGGAPSVIAVSADESFAYVGLYGTNGYKRINLTAGQVSGRIDLDTGSIDSGYPVGMDVDPSDPKRIVVTFQSSFSSANGGATIYHDGVKLPSTLGIYDGTGVVFANASTVITQDIGFSPARTHRCSVDANGLTEIEAPASLPVGWMGRAGNRVVNTGGAIFDPATLQLIGSFPSGMATPVHPASDTGYSLIPEGSGSMRAVSFRISTGAVSFDKSFDVALPSFSFEQTQPSLAPASGTVAFRISDAEIGILSGL